MSKRYVSDARLQSAPPIPGDRPPTRAEVWAYVTHVYEGLWSEDRMRQHARETWAGNYIHWVNGQGWTKRPDWQPGDDETPVLSPPIDVGNANYSFVKSLLETERIAA